MTRADLEEEQRRQRIADGLDPDPDLAARAAQRSSGGAGEDGSFSRSGVATAQYCLEGSLKCSSADCAL